MEYETINPDPETVDPGQQIADQWQDLAEDVSPASPDQPQPVDRDAAPPDVSKANYKQLKRTYGEEFFKEVRGTLSEFADIPGFAGELRRLIPNSHKALKTLRDNYDYIQATLKAKYQESGAIETEAPRDPYELARRVGYQLTPPLETTEEVRAFTSDFRRGERLCTFNNIAGRLKSYHILWLRADNADNIPPADQLTADDLTPEWQQYLRETGRYDAATDSYDLNGLAPAREDPYGTSSMSVQISRTGSHVSIKNRYNHTVSNPDSTLKNNLNNLVPGLQLAVFHEVGRDDLLKDAKLELSEGYIRDNDGGVHQYYYEKDNVYYGHHETIHNGEVRRFPEGEYYMLAPDLYVRRGKKPAEDKVAHEYTGTPEDAPYNQTSFEVTEDGTHQVHCLKDGEPIMTYSYRVDEKGKIQDLKLTVTGDLHDNIRFNPSLTSLKVSGEAVDIFANPALASLDISGKAGYIYRNSAITSLDIPGIVGDIYENPALTSLAISGFAWYIDNNPSLTNLKISGETWGIFENPALTSLEISGKVVYIARNPALTSLEISGNVGHIYDNHPDIKIIHRENKHET